MKLTSFLTLLLIAVSPGALWADVVLPPVISSGMVIQRGRPVPVFGRAEPGEEVRVMFRGETADTTADREGRWSVKLPPQEAGGPFEMAVAGNTTINLQDVYCGDVWLCSGQSNMAETVSKIPAAEEVKTHETVPQLRLFVSQPRGTWAAASPQTAMSFSAVGYFFGRDLWESQQVPIGLISAASGGSSAEQWIDPELLRSLGITDNGETRGPWGGLYEQMIQPLVPFAIRGVIWYQGESNTTRFVRYQEVMTALIESWRDEWGQGEFPFYFVQLARQGKGGGSLHFSEGWPSLRDAQRRTLAMPNTGMAVSFDVSDGNTHPPDKKPIALRLARIARARDYGEAIEFSGPMYKSIEWGDGRATLHFDHADGLHASGNQVEGFLIGGLNTGFQSAEAKVVGKTVVIAVPPDSSPRTAEVRYAWGKYPEANLYNAAGLPASPFSTAARLTESEHLISQREVQALVRAVILAPTPEEVRTAAKEVEDYITDNEIRRQELSSFTQMLTGSKPFSNGQYGISEAREQLQQWAKGESP